MHQKYLDGTYSVVMQDLPSIDCPSLYLTCKPLQELLKRTNLTYAEELVPLWPSARYGHLHFARRFWAFLSRAKLPLVGLSVSGNSPSIDELASQAHHNLRSFTVRLSAWPRNATPKLSVRVLNASF